MNRPGPNKMAIIPLLSCTVVIAIFLLSNARRNEKNPHFICSKQAIEIKSGSDLSRKDAKIIYLENVHDLTISDRSIAGGAKACITLINCYNINIAQNKLYNSSDVGIRLYRCKDVHVYNNYFTNLSTGVYAEKTNEGRIQVDHNQFLNMRGPYPRGQFIQFNNVNGPGNKIEYNRCENIIHKSNPEDAISLYKCNGTSKSPITIRGNWIRGGGPSHSGGGIMLGDNGGSYQTAVSNKLVDAGQYGIAISGGDHNSIIDNYIFARARQFTNVGVYVAGYNGFTCTNSIVAHNRVRYFNNKQILNNSWLGPGASKPAGWDSNFWSADISAGLLPVTIITCK